MDRSAAIPPDIDVANRVLACRSFEDVSATLLPDLTTFFGASSSCAFEMRREDQRLVLGRSVQMRMPARALQDYGMHFVNLDPVCAQSFGAEDSRRVASCAARIVRLSDRCPSRVLLNSEYYNDFLRAVRIRHVFAMMVRPESDPSRIMVLGFHRPDDDRDFDIELSRAAALSPAFQATIERAYFREQSAVFGGSAGALEAWAERVHLTPRETDVAREVVRGLRNAEIATRLDLSLRTVENHLRSIFAKADVRSRTQLLRSAMPLSPSE
jgi:DNA-binding CsgD family transcriptional regulator